MRRLAIPVVVLVAYAVTGVFAQPRGGVEATAMAEFSKRVAAYAELAKDLTAKLPALKKTDDPTAISGRETALGEAIRAGRAGARPGAIFAPDAARVFRRTIKHDFRARPTAGQKVMLDDMPHFHPKINQSYPSEWPLATFPPTLLPLLPALPDGLEYRLLSEALILRDIKANIIVDFILDVL
jgi:hypothetical protein